MIVILVIYVNIILETGSIIFIYLWCILMETKFIFIYIYIYIYILEISNPLFDSLRKEAQEAQEAQTLRRYEGKLVASGRGCTKSQSKWA